MKNYIPIYNMVTSSFFRKNDDKVPTVNEILDSPDYFSLGMIEATDLENAFEVLNIRIPQKISDKVNQLAKYDPKGTKYPRLHTSMSVCDVLVEINPEGNKHYLCDSIGWIELSF